MLDSSKLNQKRSGKDTTSIDLIYDRLFIYRSVSVSIRLIRGKSYFVAGRRWELLFLNSIFHLSPSNRQRQYWRLISHIMNGYEW